MAIAYRLPKRSNRDGRVTDDTFLSSSGTARFTAPVNSFGRSTNFCLISIELALFNGGAAAAADAFFSSPTVESAISPLDATGAGATCTKPESLMSVANTNPCIATIRSVLYCHRARQSRRCALPFHHETEMSSENKAQNHFGAGRKNANCSGCAVCHADSCNVWR